MGWAQGRAQAAHMITAPTSATATDTAERGSRGTSRPAAERAAQAGWLHAPAIAHATPSAQFARATANTANPK